MATAQYLKWGRSLAVGVMGVALAAPLAASAAVPPGLRDVVADPPRVVAPPPIPTVRVLTPRDLLLTLYSDFKGRVIIPAGAQWDLSGFAWIPLRSGVSLLGERGPLGSRPLLYTDNKGETYSLFEITGNDVSVQGIHLRGPAAGSRSSSQPYVDAIRILEDPAQQLGRRIVIADNEFNEWTGSAVEVRSTNRVLRPQDYPPGVPRIRPEDAGLVRIERNYLHHNAREGGGYGVTVGGGAYATIWGNVFDFNRHAVASDGRAYSGYIARFNYVLQGGFLQGNYYNQHFDVHGTAPKGDDDNSGYGGTAGEYYEIAFNTIRGAQTYYSGFKTRPAFMLRGKATMGAHFNANIAVHDDLDGAVSLKMDKGDTGWGEDHDRFNFHAAGNAFDKDYSTEVAAGDFDGDGRTDVFVANGTAWFFSRGGVRPWEFLHASTKRLHELALADIDNDGVTDVLYRDGNGNLGYLKSGTHDLVPLTTLPVPLPQVRFGDFEGDGKTDLFYTRGGQWWIWYGSTRLWTSAQTSSLPLSEFVFGEFDGVRGTDVAAVTSEMWAISSGARGSWTKLNNKLVGSFAGAVAADFDGNGRSDIAFNDGRDWRYSRDGREPLVLLRDGDDDGLLIYPPLKSLLIGRFDGGARATVVSFERKVVILPYPQTSYLIVPGERLIIWWGLGSGPAFSMRSEQNMR